MICSDCKNRQHEDCKGCPCQHGTPIPHPPKVDGESKVSQEGDSQLLAAEQETNAETV
jgi:hypothetical protein